MKYYWLKLRRDFFKRHDVRIIEGQQNGKAYILFYLKLLVESVDHNGALRFSDAIPYTPEMLATITDTDADTVKQALALFTDLKLVSVTDDGTLILNEVPEMIGAAADNDNAKRQARYRNNKRSGVTPALPDRYASVTDSVTKNNASVTDSNATNNAPVTVGVTKSNENKNIELEIETDIEIDNVNRTKNKRFVPPTPDEILDYMTNYCFERSLDANPISEAEKFFNYYEANGWRVGKNKMKSWRGAASNWLLNAKDFKAPDASTNPFKDL